MSKQLPFSTVEVKPHNRFSARNLALVIASAGLLATGYNFSHHSWSLGDQKLLAPDQSVWNDADNPARVKTFQQCAIDNLLETGLPFMKNVAPIAVADFEERRDRLAQALVAEGADAFVVEPGYTFKYYGNVSQPEWEVWEVRQPSKSSWAD